MPGTNPAQQEIIDRLSTARGDRPGYDAELRHQLRWFVEDGIADAVASLPADHPTIFVSKSRLAAVHGCEERFLQDDFSWSVPAARGKVAHKAIELSVHWREEPLPLVLVDEALARLENGEDGFALWLQALPDVERAELRAEAGERVLQFLECWPPLKKQWRPGTEVSIRQELHDGRVVLAGKVDLTIGAPDGLVAGKVLVDLKTGSVRPVHFEDLRFYALVETMRLGTPPLRLASYYLDQGALHPEDVNEGVLRAAAMRTIDGVVKMIELATRARPPRRSPSALCRWCPVKDTCDDGLRHLAGQGEPWGEDDNADW